MYCSKCGKENSEKNKFCKYCGTPFNVAQGASVENSQKVSIEDRQKAGKEKRHSHKGIAKFLMILIIICVIAGGGAAIWYYGPDITGYFSQDNSYDEDEVEEENNEEDEQNDPASAEVGEDSSKEVGVEEIVEKAGRIAEKAEDLITATGADGIKEDSETDMMESKNPVKDRLQGEKIEPEVKRIREIYNNTVAMCSTDNQIEVEGIMGNYDANGNIIRITIPKSDTNDYAMWLYYENERLIFAYLEGNDAYRIYFYNEQIFRIRYTSDPNNPNDAYNIENEELETYLKNDINEDDIVNMSREMVTLFH